MPVRLAASATAGRLDTFTEAGARRLAWVIRDYWYTLGWDVTVRVEPVTWTTNGRLYQSESAYQVRSDMVNGQPVARLAVAA